MNGFKKVISSPAFSIVSLLIAGGLLFFAGIGGARAALQYYSENYQAQMDVHDIGVTLIENDTPISWRNYEGQGRVDYSGKGEDEKRNWVISEGLVDGEGGEYDALLTGVSEDKFQLGTKYNEVLKVQNSGTVDQYVRVIIHKYWLDESDKKNTKLTPDQIDLHFDEDHVGKEGSDKDWIIDADDQATQNERTILYYTKLLKVNEISDPLTDYFQINSDLGRTVSQETKKETIDGKEYTTITTTYEYDGQQFCIEAKVDAVQDHHAEDAILSAWGRRVTISNGKLSLVKEQ
jgi:hypothetical protein